MTSGMPYEIVMPQLGLTMTEGSVNTWLKEPGEWVQKGEILFTVETDKVEMEVECYGSGYLSEILIETDQMVPVGTLLATLSEAPEVAAVPIQPAQPVAPADPPPVSPRARRVAQELRVNLAEVHPQGSRVTEEDVRRHFEKSGAPQPATASEQPQAPVSKSRAVIAKRMTGSFQTAPHFYLGVEAKAAAMVTLREALNGEARGKVRITYTDFFLKALAEAMQDHPHVNGFWNGETVVSHDRIDIGCAIQTEDGLVAPVIRNAARLDLFGISENRSELVRKAQTRSLTVADMEGGSATLSNLGQSGVDWFQAILNPPQSVILAVGRVAERAVALDHRIRALPTVHLNLSADHRVLDGATAAAFLVRVQQLIEQPALLLMARSPDSAAHT